MRRPGYAFRWALLVLVLVVGDRTLADDACPASDAILERVRELKLERGTRTVKYEIEPPARLYEKASRKVGTPYTTRDGHKGQGVMVVELPMDDLWRALNDENRHDEEGSKIPVRHSEVIDGSPGGADRVVFQWAKQMGLGRWWVSRVWMNRELYVRSQHQLWEVLWKDKMDTVDPEAPPVNAISSRLSPIKSSQGAWLLASIGDSCTLVEYFNWSDPGGMIGVAQPLIIGRALRSTLVGVADLARLYGDGKLEGVSFEAPDGSPLQ